MLKPAFAAFALIAAAPALGQEAPPPAATPMSAEAIAADPRMIAAVRHANLLADHKCGENVGGVTDLATKAAAQRCRRRMVATAKLDAEGEITGH